MEPLHDGLPPLPELKDLLVQQLNTDRRRRDENEARMISIVESGRFKPSPRDILRKQAENAAKKNGLFYQLRRKDTLEKKGALLEARNDSPTGDEVNNDATLLRNLERQASSDYYESLIANLGPEKHGWTYYMRYTYQACARILEALAAEDDGAFANSIRARLAKIQWAFTDPQEAIDHLSVWCKKGAEVIGNGNARIECTVRLNKEGAVLEGMEEQARMLSLMAARNGASDPNSASFLTAMKRYLHTRWVKAQAGWDWSCGWPDPGEPFLMNLTEPLGASVRVWFAQKFDAEDQTKHVTLRVEGPIASCL